MRELIPVCKQFAVTGTTKQAKQAIRCLYVNLAHGQDAVFSEILEVREVLHYFLLSESTLSLFLLYTCFRFQKYCFFPIRGHFYTCWILFLVFVSWVWWNSTQFL
jgi:hypothetical protein